MHPVVWLALAIGSEIIATVALKLSEGFSKPIPVVVVVLGYGLSFYALSMSLRTIPLGVVYAVWSGVGTAAVAVIGVLLFRELLDDVKSPASASSSPAW
jgi:small multidrug resistance pump